MFVKGLEYEEVFVLALVGRVFWRRRWYGWVGRRGRGVGRVFFFWFFGFGNFFSSFVFLLGGRIVLVLIFGFF